MFRDGAERFLVFGVGAERFAVALSAVEEVIDLPPVQPIPDAPKRVLGLTAIRGSLVTLYDPRPLLNVEGTERDAALLFVRRDEALDEDRRIGLVIDALFDPIVVNGDDVQSAPGADSSDSMLLGVVRIDSELIAILDANVLLDRLTADGSEAKVQSGGVP